MVGTRPVEGKSRAERDSLPEAARRAGAEAPGNAVRDLRGTVERGGALLGVLITLEAPTKPMVQEAAAAGFYQSATWQKSYPRLQLRTVEELLAGQTVERPPTVAMDETCKKAPKARAKGHQQGQLL